jgi:23S rRNA (uracil1939-C5)-methyltransferase
MRMNAKETTPVNTEPYELTITKLVYGGTGLGRHNGKVVLVPFTAPGDRLLVKTVEEKKNLSWAEVVRVLVPGQGRVTPQCPEFQRCGGCHWQHLEYSRQVEAKRQILEELCHHKFPKTRDLTIAMTGSPREYEYRSRARVQLRIAGPEPSFGYFQHHSHEVIDIWACPLLQPHLNSWFKWIRDHYQDDPGMPDESQMEIASADDQFHSCVSIPVAAGPEDSYTIPINHGFGNGPVFEKHLGDFTYRVSPAAFFQANDFLVTDLVNIVLGLAGTSPEGSVLDLYCGVGLFTLPLARRFGNVTAIESSRISCSLAAANADAAGLKNVRVVCADVPVWMRAAGSITTPGFDAIVLDPPRSGAGREVMAKVREWAPETLVYVSCDPQTLARDLALLPETEYEIRHIEGLDMFPQTFHFETVVLMKRM